MTAGALAVLAWACTPSRTPPPTVAAPPPITAASCLALLSELPHDRHPQRVGHREAREWLVTRLAALGLPARRLPFRWEGLPDAELVNLEVRLGLPGGPLVVATAHYDSVRGTPGADDNGSGVVALLEVARRLADRRLPCELRLVWLDAEELGLVGSRAWVSALSPDERARFVGCLNLESVGYADRRPGSQRLPPGARLLHDPGDRADFLLVLGNQASAALAEVAALGLGAEAGEALRVEVFSLLPGAGWLVPDSRRSDHASFWDAGLPAVMLTDTAPFRNPWYHSPGDRVETLDGEFLAAAARGVERALLLLAVEGDEAR